MSCIINKFIKETGEYNYAYVVMIINDDIYANPGIIFAESLKKLGCQCDIIAMIDEKISLDAIVLLKNFFNKIIKIDKIEIEHINPIQNIILSKINVYKMIGYEKIFLIDVDTIILSNPDNFFLQSNITHSNSLCMVDIENYGYILISPSNDIYNKCLKLISTHKKEINKSSKPFEFVLNHIYKSYDIKKLDFKISYNSYSNVDAIQYRADKPFLMASNLSIEQRQRLDHFKIWFSFLTNIINKFPEIKEYKCVSETIKISKYFLASLSRFILDFTKFNNIKKNKNIINITNIYGSNKYTNLHYYHLDLAKEYTNKFIKYNIDIYDIKSFMDYLKTITNTDLFLNYYKYTDVKLIIKKLEQDNKDLLNFFLNNYIKFYSNTFVTIEISSDKNSKDSNVSDLKNNLIYRTKINLKNITLKNVIFNLFQNFTYNQRILFITKYLNEPDYTITISIYDMIGTIIEYDKNVNLDLFIFYEQSSKVKVSSIFFNKNTLKHYENVPEQKNTLNTLNILNIFGNEPKLKYLPLKNIIQLIYLQTLKKFIFSVYSGDQIDNLCLYWEDYNKITLIDNNKHLIGDIKNINMNKIFFITIIFSSMSQYKNILNKMKINPYDIYDLDKYWEFEGIKIFN